MELRIIKKGFNYSQDGRGNRLVYHLQGCNMRCPWCSNPEGMRAEGTQVTENGRVRPSFFTMSTEELAEEAATARTLFFDDGGVTFSGGEPTLQFDALRDALVRLKQRGISTAVETNATHPRLPELFPLLDECIMDCKHYDDEIHRRVTGVSNQTVLRNLARALAEHGNVLVRTVLVHGFNDTPADAEGFLSIYRNLPAERARFEFLPYHEIGKVKWEQCGLPYGVTDGFVRDEVRSDYEARYRRAGLTVVRT